MTYLSVPSPHHGGIQTQVDRLVFHGTVSPCVPGRAAVDAGVVRDRGLSCHYFVDPTTTVGQLPENVMGWHDGYGINEVGFEFCDPQKDTAAFGPAAADPQRWYDPPHTAMLLRGAALMRGVASRWNVPLAHITYDLRVPPLRGFCGHCDVSQTWHMSTHVDPQDMPWDHFMGMVNPSPIVVRPTPEPAPAPTDGSITMSDGHQILWGTPDGAPDATTSVPSLLKLNGILNQLVAGQAAQTAQQAQLAATLKAQGATLAGLQAQIAGKA